MKKTNLIIIAIACLCSSCATMLTGPVTDYQHEQLKKEKKRQVQKGWLIMDVVFCAPCVFVDFQTGKIYKPAEQ